MVTNSRTTRGIWFVLGSTLCLGFWGCGDPWASDPTGFSFAYFHDDCAPWDGLALSIVLSDEEFATPFEAHFPSVRVTSYRPPPQLAGASFEWTGVAQDLGYAAWCASSEACTAASSVRVRFDRSQAEADVLAGQVHLEFEGRSDVSGAFRAVRLTTQMLCG